LGLILLVAPLLPATVGFLGFVLATLGGVALVGKLRLRRHIREVELSDYYSALTGRSLLKAELSLGVPATANALLAAMRIFARNLDALFISKPRRRD
jgi:hypothetical protein